ncbi:MAG: hypothetical protein Ct9H90mP16_14850 [Candidatus Poseidoniales archaeon]|nr:MAG: hypothetical protein Ct9H90mP16_14850 [Candidatus Poseidoniales archaeon]
MKSRFFSAVGLKDLFRLASSCLYSLPSCFVGGKGSRMLQGGVTTHKPLLEVGGMPATRFVVEGLLGGRLEFSQILVVVPPGREAEYADALAGWGAGL